MKRAISALAAIHLAVALWHGSAHNTLAVTLTPAKTAFVILVILIAPLVGASLVWTRQVMAGTWIFTLAMLGALIFGAYHHYVLVSPDNIAHLPEGDPGAHATFITTAGALAILELGAALYGAFCLGGLYKRTAGPGGEGKGDGAKR